MIVSRLIEEKLSELIIDAKETENKKEFNRIKDEVEFLKRTQISLA